MLYIRALFYKNAFLTLQFSLRPCYKKRLFSLFSLVDSKRGTIALPCFQLTCDTTCYFQIIEINTGVEEGEQSVITYTEGGSDSPQPVVMAYPGTGDSSSDSRGITLQQQSKHIYYYQRIELSVK